MPLSHHESVKNSFEKAISNEHMVVIFIDEYHNLHITHRPSKATQSGSPGNPNRGHFSDFLERNSTKLARSYVAVMLDRLEV